MKNICTPLFTSGKEALYLLLLVLCGYMPEIAAGEMSTKSPSPKVTFLGEKTTADIQSTSSDVDPFTQLFSFTATSAGTANSLAQSPQNANGQVGESQYILMSYGALRSFDKTTGRPDGVLDTPAASFFGFRSQDVRILYDRHAKRWYMSCQQQDISTGRVVDFYLVVSSDAVITNSTKWSFYKVTNDQSFPGLIPPGSGSVDFPQLACDKDAVYIGIRIYDKNEPPPISTLFGASAIVFEKKSLLEGNPTITVYPKLALNNAAITPADNFDADSKFGYFTYPYYSNEEERPIGTQIKFMRISNPGTANPLLEKELSVTVPQFCWPFELYVPHKGNFFGEEGKLQWGIGSKFENTHVRDKQLYILQMQCLNQAGESVAKSEGGDRHGVRWYRFDLTGDQTGQGLGEETASTPPVLIKMGLLYDAVSIINPKSYFIPSVATNKNGDMVITCSVASANTYTDMMYASRKISDPEDQPFIETIVTNNDSTLHHPYNYGPMLANSGGNGQRWGDQSFICVDPANDLNFWITCEWAALYNAWGIQTVVLEPK